MESIRRPLKPLRRPMKSMQNGKGEPKNGAKLDEYRRRQMILNTWVQGGKKVAAEIRKQCQTLKPRSAKLAFLMTHVVPHEMKPKKPFRPSTFTQAAAIEKEVRTITMVKKLC